MSPNKFEIPNDEARLIRNALRWSLGLAVIGAIAVFLRFGVKFPKGSVNDILLLVGALFLVGSLIPAVVIALPVRRLARTKKRLIKEMNAGRYLACWSTSSHNWRKICLERQTLDLDTFRQNSRGFAKLVAVAMIALPFYIWFREGFDSKLLEVWTLLFTIIIVIATVLGTMGLGRWLLARKHRRMLERIDSPPVTMITKDGWFNEGNLVCYNEMKDLFTDVKVLTEPVPALELIFETNGMRYTLRAVLPDSAITEAQGVARSLREEFRKHGAKIEKHS